MMNENFKYDIFISYKHEETDRKVAQYLQRALEQYKIPVEIQKKTGKTKIKRVFRDEEELAVASDLSEEIEEQLRQTEFLLVVCSKKTKESIWVQREIQTFLKYRSRRYVLPVLVDGEPEESFPDIILEGGEPLAADLRGSSQKEILANAKKELPRIVAPVLKCSYDELRQRHKAYQMKRIAWISGIVAAVAVIFGAYSFKQNIEIKENYTKKLENQSRYLAQTSEELLHKGDREAAMLVALAALPEGEADDSRPLVAEARMALESSLYLYRDPMASQLFPYEKAAHPTELQDEFSYYNGDETLVAVRDDNGHLYIEKGDSLENVLTMKDTHWKQAVFNRQGHLIANSGDEYSGASTDRLVCLDPYTEEIIWEKQPYNGETPFYMWTYHKETDQVVLIQYGYIYDYTNPDNERTEMKVTFMDGGTGAEQSWNMSRKGTAGPKYIELSPTGANMAMLFSDSFLKAEEAVNEICIYGAKDGALLYSEQIDGWLPSDSGKGWLDEDTFAAGFLAEYSMGWNGAETPWKVIALDVQNQKIKWSYEDESLNLMDHMVIDSYDVKNADGMEETVLSIISNNVHTILNGQTGVLYNRMEDHNVIQRVFLLQSGKAFLYVMQTGNVYLSGVYESVTYNPIWNYNYELGIDLVTDACNIGNVLYVIEGENLHTYTAITEVNGTEIPEAGGMLEAVFSRDGTYFYCGSSSEIVLCKTEGTELIGTLEVNYSENSHCFVKDKILAYISPERSLKLYDIEAKTEKEIALGNSYSYQIAEAGDGKVLIWSSNECYLADGTRGEILSTYLKEDLLTIMKENDDTIEVFSISGVLLTEDERYIIFIDGTQGIMKIWDREKECMTPLPEEEEAMLVGVDVSNVYYNGADQRSLAGNQLVLYGKDKKIRIYDISKSEVVFETETDGVGAQHVIFAPDSDYLVFINGNNQLRVLNWKTGEYTVAGLERLNKYGTAYFEFSPDGSQLYVRSVEGMSTPVMYFYEMKEPGVYEKQTAVSFCYGTNGDKLVVKESGAATLSDIYTLDELIAMAREKLNGRELTPEEKNEYLVEN